MASESSDERSVAVSLPADVDEWLDAKAGELDLDREVVVVQLLAAYRAADELDDDPVGAALTDGIEREVRDVVADRVDDIAAAVSERVDTGDAEAVEDRLSAEIDRVASDFDSKIQDVRERVVQVKRETDSKAEGGHAHAEFDDLAALSGDVEDLTDRVTDLSAAVETAEDERGDLEARVAELEGLADRLDDVEEKLQTVAWVVSDLRETVDAEVGGSRAIDRLKQSAAEADVDRAVCENCSNAVDIALLSEPECPHCRATVSDVEPSGGFFRKPRLTVASQLEAGDAGDEESDENTQVPDAARRDP